MEGILSTVEDPEVEVSTVVMVEESIKHIQLPITVPTVMKKLISRQIYRIHQNLTLSRDYAFIVINPIISKDIASN